MTLTRDEHVTSVLVALRKGAVMREHRAPSAATVVLISGRASFAAAGGESTLLEPGSLAAFSADVPHAVEAIEDAVYLVTVMLAMPRSIACGLIGALTGLVTDSLSQPRVTRGESVTNGKGKLR